MEPNTYNQANQAYAQGQQLQSQYNNQANQLYGQYQGAQSNANQANQNLANFTNNLPDYGQAYQQDLRNAQGMYGFDPAELLQAQKALAATQTTIANLPEAIRQQGNYYGTTAGQEANNYAQQAGLLQGVLAGQSNSVSAFQNMINATQAQAAQQAGLGLQSQQTKLQGLQAQANNYVSIMQNMGSMMAQIEQLAQQQGGMTAAQQAQYAQAYQAYSQANIANAQMQQNINVLKQGAGMVNQQAGQGQGKISFGSNPLNLQSALNSGGIRWYSTAMLDCLTRPHLR